MIRLLTLGQVMYLLSPAAGDAATLGTKFLLRGEPSEISGEVNDAAVSPAAGVLGTLKLPGSASVFFAPAQTGQGVYFSIANNNNGYYQFSGTELSDLFSLSEGEISFYLKSRQSWAERRAATQPRYVFDVRPDGTSHPFYFAVNSYTYAGGVSYLFLNYAIAGLNTYYAVTPGQEDTLFGDGIVLKVRITWDGVKVRLYLNDVLRQESAYTASQVSWTAGALFYVGAYASPYGAYYSSDDVIDEFTIRGPVPSVDTKGPSVFITSPANSSTITTGSTTVSAAATDNIAVTGVSFRLDGNPLGEEVTSPPYTIPWNASQVLPGVHNLTAIARDAAGNTTTSAPAVVTVAIDRDPPAITSVIATPLNGSSTTITWKTNEPSDSQVVYGLAPSSYTLSSSVNPALVSSHAVTLTGLSPSTTYHFAVRSRDAAGNPGQSANFSFITRSASSPTLGWTELTETKLRTVCPPDNFGGQNYLFKFRCYGVISAWNSAITDTLRNRMIIWGGGHDNYYGNEIYALNLGVSPPTMVRLTDPSPINTTSQCPAALADGKPNSRETFNTLVHLPHADKMFVFNGSLACGDGLHQSDTWVLDLNTLEWQRMDPVNGSPKPADGYGPSYQIADYDPNTRSVYMVWGDSFWQYTYETNTYQRLRATGAHVPYAGTGAIDPKRRLFVFMGREYQDPRPHIYAIDLSPGSTYAAQNWTSQVTGCDGLASVEYPGLVYDPVLERFVGWPNAGNTVYIFNPDTKSCTQQFFPGGPPDSLVSGTFGRFRYFPALGKYVVVTHADLNAFTLRIDTSAAPAPDTQAPTKPAGLTVTGTTATQVSLSWNASTDNVAVTGYRVYRNGTQVGTAPGTTFTDSGLSGGTTYSYTVAAQDGAGNVSTASDAVNGTTTTSGGDTIAPTVSITEPDAGETVSGTVTVTASASDDVGVTSVQFQIDGADVGSAVTSPPYTYSWDTTGASNGTHTLRAVARDAAGNVTTSAAVTVTVSNTAVSLNTVFHLRGEAAELTAAANGATVTPAVGVSGVLRLNSGGSVNFTPATVGNGVYFLNCCGNSGNAYFVFSGTQVGNVFDTGQGEVSFYLKSRQNWAQRRTGQFRTVFDVQNTAGSYLFGFIVNPTSVGLAFGYRLGSAAMDYYYVPAGQEDTLFGNGVTLKVRLVWDGTRRYLYLNDTLQKTTTYVRATASWTAGSTFTLGGQTYFTAGAFNSSDDVIDEFVVKLPAP